MDTKICSNNPTNPPPPQQNYCEQASPIHRGIDMPICENAHLYKCAFNAVGALYKLREDIRHILVSPLFYLLPRTIKEVAKAHHLAAACKESRNLISAITSTTHHPGTRCVAPSARPHPVFTTVSMISSSSSGRSPFSRISSSSSVASLTDENLPLI